MLCVSENATDVGANSCEKHGAGMSMLAKCAACPPSWKSVSVARRPAPTTPGIAFAVNWMRAGRHAPRSRQAGTGPCMKPFSYLPGRSTRSRISVAPR
jgi:hypothetical protein